MNIRETKTLLKVILGRDKMKRILEKERIFARDLMVTKMITISGDEVLSQAIGKMNERIFHELPVLDNDGGYMGLLSMDFMIKRRNLPLTARVRNMLSIPPKVSVDDDLSELAENILISGVRTLPVLSDNILVGVVSRTDIVKVLPSLNEFKDISVDSIMSHYPESVNERDGIGKAKSLIRELPEQIIPVVDDNDRLTGVIGTKDMVSCMWGMDTQGKNGWKGGDSFPSNIEIKSVMMPPITVPSGTSAGDAAQLMSDHNITSVIVTEDGKPVGVVTQLNLIELIASGKKRDEVYIQISGLSDESSFELDSLYSIIQDSLQEIAKVTTPSFFSMHVAQYNIENGGSKYSIRVIMDGSRKKYFAKSHNWNLMKATDEVMNSLEKMVKKDIVRRRDKDRESRRG